MKPGRSYSERSFMNLPERWIELVKRVLCNSPQIYDEPGIEPEKRRLGLCWPHSALTMIGRARLDNVHFCCRQAIYGGVAGDFVECGVWRGGAAILMRACHEAYDQDHYDRPNDARRQVWCYDSFAGLPKPDLEPWPDDKPAGNQHAIPYPA